MKLFYKQYGENKPAFFILHGIFGMLDNWHNIAKHLSEHYTVYTIDARNHGQSPHSMEMGYEVMADDVIELADDLGLKTFILMGHSMGGKTAMVVVDKYPERISRLIVVDIAPKAYKPGHLTYFKAFEDIDWSRLNSRKDIDEALMPYETDPGIRLFLAKNIERNDSGGFMVRSNMPALRSAYEEIIGALHFKHRYTGPSLFITGALSRYLKETDKPYILEHFPNTRFSVVSNAGHWVHADNPKEFLEKLL
ncbi:MAG: alpha/beta fold hydrolase [Bacteroidetes bacterium]|nr:alpha/beta fold hydrolase [Bacteroidota bacterium]